MIAVGTNQNMIYLGDHEIQGIYAGDLLIYPDTPEPPTPTGDTHVIACIYDINSTSRQTPLTYINTCAVKVELEDGTDIPLNTAAPGESSGTSAYQFSTTGEQIVYVTVTGDTIDYLFYGCSRLKSVVIPEGITGFTSTFYMPDTSPWIGPLYSTSVLDTVALPSTLVTIGAYSFRNCDSLSGITIPSGVTSLGDFAFENCNNLTGITISSSVTSIGVKAFANCTSLIDIVFPNTVLSVGDGVMSGCTSLTGATLSTSVPYTSNYMFYGCTSLQSFTIPSHVTRLGNHSFVHTGLVSITIPDTVLELGDNTGDTSTIGSVFSYCTALTSVTIGSGVTIIPRNTFMSCSALSAITIPNTVTIVNTQAFRDCSSLQTISLSTNTWGYGSKCFYGCNSLQSIEFPDSVTWIGQDCMVNCSGLTAITLYSTTPPGTTDTGSIMNYVFGNYFFSTHYPIYVPCESVEAYKTAFPDYASGFTCVEPETRLVVTYNVTSTTRTTNILYTGTTGFSKAELEDGTEIPVAKTYMFPETGQTKVYYTLTGTSTPEKAFYNLKNIVGVELPSSGLEEVGVSSFTNCWNIVNLTIPNNVQRIDEAAFATCCGATGTINIPSDCVVGAQAFYRCRSFTGITVQSGATLGYKSFYMGSSVKNITIKPDVTFVSGDTFGSTYDSLEEVIFEGAPQQNQQSIFTASESYRYIIYVPNDQVDAWKQWFDGITKSRVCPISERTIPAAYKRLAFLRNKTSVGDGYVEADYSEPGFNENMWAEYDFGLTNLPTGSTQVHILSGDNYRFAEIDTAGNWSVRRGGESLTITSSPFVSGSTGTLVTRTYTFFKNGDNIEVDGVVVGSIIDPGTSSDNIHPRFFSVNGSDDYTTYGAVGFLFRGKIGNKDEGSSLIAHYVPAQRRSDDVYGLWDFVTSTFLPVNNGASGN